MFQAAKNRVLEDGIVGVSIEVHEDSFESMCLDQINALCIYIEEEGRLISSSRCFFKLHTCSCQVTNDVDPCKLDNFRVTSSHL